MDRDEIKNEDLNKLYPLKEIDDIEVADHDPDVRGWQVYGADGTKIGEVEELIVNPAEMKVRYLDVELDENVRSAETGAADEERHIIVPIGRATLHEKDDRVILNDVQLNGIRDFPSYTGELTREFEDRVLNTFQRAEGRRITNVNQESRGTQSGEENNILPSTAKHDKELVPEEFYKRGEFDESRFYAPRRKNTNMNIDTNSLRRRS